MIKLTELLEAYSESGAYPMHMPGHKRNTLLLPDYKIDLTEVAGFDDLHCPEGILKECMEYAAAVYGSKDTIFSVNGSTCALHAAIYASTKAGDKVLTARNCHKSVYNMIAVRGLKPVYTYTDRGYPEAEEIRRLLEREQDIKAAVITSPSYDGTVCDIRKIAGICHERNVILIVDEAHGAHLPFAEKAGKGQYFTESAMTQGADIVVHSLHKTLPAMTQTAVLHRMSDRVSAENLRHALSVFESSSPSYVLMASIDACIHYMEEHCRELFETYTERLKGFYAAAAKEFPLLFEQKRLAANIRECVAEEHAAEKAAAQKSGIRHYDPGKILICGKNLSMTGREIYDILVKDYGIMPEMSAGDYCLCMTGVCDTEEGFRRLENALRSIYAERISRLSARGSAKSRFDSIYPPHTDKCFCIPAEAERYQRTKTELKTLLSVLTDEKKDCHGDGNPKENPGCRGSETLKGNPGCRGNETLKENPVAAELIAVYPPGAPVLVPGEYATKETIQYIIEALEAGNEVYGVHEGCIYVLSEE